MKTKKLIIFLYVIPAILIFIALYYFRGVPFEDDAYIFYRYAANWAAGYGPVFNIGEHVEGYSSFLWTAILAVGNFFSLKPVTVAPHLNLFIGILCLLMISYLTSLVQFSKPRLMSFLVPVFCALSYGFYYYGAAGMDTMIFSLVLMYCIFSIYNSINTGRFFSSLLSLFLLNLVRVEGFVYSTSLVIIMVFLVALKESKIESGFYFGKLPKSLFGSIIIFSFGTVMLFIMRYGFYHEWLPATVMAKGYGTHLFKKAVIDFDYQSMKNFFRVLMSGLKYEAFFIFLGLWIPFFMLVLRKKHNDSLLWLIAGSIGVNIFVSVWAGGDYFPYERHFIPVLPIVIVLAAWALDIFFCRLWKASSVKKIMVVSLSILFVVSFSVFFIKPVVFAMRYNENGRSLYLRQIGTLLYNVKAPTTMLSQMIGKISYYSESKVYVRDILGLTDIHNAKYGDEWGFNWGMGGCGRTDFDYSFKTPFDIFFYNSKNMHKKFISFCEEKPTFCTNYRFFKTNEWIRTETYVIADIQHPVANALEDQFGAVPLEIDENLEGIMKTH